MCSKLLLHFADKVTSPPTPRAAKSASVTSHHKKYFMNLWPGNKAKQPTEWSMTWGAKELASWGALLLMLVYDTGVCRDVQRGWTEVLKEVFKAALRGSDTRSHDSWVISVLRHQLLLWLLLWLWLLLLRNHLHINQGLKCDARLWRAGCIVAGQRDLGRGHSIAMMNYRCNKHSMSRKPNHLPHGQTNFGYELTELLCSLCQSCLSRPIILQMTQV